MFLLEEVLRSKMTTGIFTGKRKFWSLGLGTHKKHGNEIGYYGQNKLVNGTRTDFLAGKEDIFLPAPSV